jgi:hypothetical protein
VEATQPPPHPSVGRSRGVGAAVAWKVTTEDSGTIAGSGVVGQHYAAQVYRAIHTLPIVTL